MSEAIRQKVSREVERVTKQAAEELTLLFNQQVEEAVFAERTGCAQIIQDEMDRLERELPFDEELWGALRDLLGRIRKRGDGD